jgi:hypothetical protein
MIATLFLLLITVNSSPACALPASRVHQDVFSSDVAASSTSPAMDRSYRPASPAADASTAFTRTVFLPLVARQPSACQPIPGVQYGTLSVIDPLTSPAEEQPDINLALRGYEVTDAYNGLVDYGVSGDPKAPQLKTLFADRRLPAFATVFQVYDWDWGCKCRGELLTNYDVTLAGLGVAPGEVLFLPDSGYNIGNDYEALVLYATEDRITLKYTGEDHVVWGYTIHVENVCVEPSLLALYRAWNDAGRGRLPALRGGQPFGRARGTEIGVAIRDTGTFMDPRSRRDWWQEK